LSTSPAHDDSASPPARAAMRPDEVGSSSGSARTEMSVAAPTAPARSTTGTAPGGVSPACQDRVDRLHQEHQAAPGSSAPSSSEAPPGARTRLQKGIHNPKNIYRWNCSLFFS
jgi:hypothetical protein